MGMRSLLALLCLAPSFVAAQSIPSLGRPSPALPITDSIRQLSVRLGKPGGIFAAAQLSLMPEGFEALKVASLSKDPLTRLDAVFGLGMRIDNASYEALIPLLGDSDPQVAEETYHFFRLNGGSQVHIFETAAYNQPPAAANVAVYLLYMQNRLEIVRQVASSDIAGGRDQALQLLFLPAAEARPLYESAAYDRREAVRVTAIRRIAFGNKSPERTAFLNKLAASKDKAIRTSLLKAVNDSQETVLEPFFVKVAPTADSDSRRQFVKTVAFSLYDPGNNPRAAEILAPLSNDADPQVADTVVDAMFLFVSDRIMSLNVNHEMRWDRLTPATVSLFRRGLGRRLKGPHGFQAAVLLAQLQDRRAYAKLNNQAFVTQTGAQSLAILSLAALGDFRATPKLIRLVNQKPKDSVGYIALGRLADPKSVRPLLKKVDESDEGLNAASAIAMIGDQRATPALLDRVKHGLSGRFYAPLGMLGGPGVREFLIDRLENGPANDLSYVTNGLVELRDPAALDDLQRIAETDKTDRGNTARSILGMIATRNQSPYMGPHWVGA